MRNTALIIFLITNMLYVKSQKIDEIKKMYVYNYFEPRGFTTAGAYTHFDDMISKNVLKIEVNQADCKKFNSIFKSIKPKKHFQSKLGIKNVFIEIQTENQNIRLVCSSINLLDLTNYKSYWIKDENQQKWIKNFINNIKNNR